MAEWGKGDERWKVEDRPDGTNVNQWHWSEKDCLAWCRQRLAQLFEGSVLLDTSRASAKLVGVSGVEGEAFLNIRKKKLIPSYELKVTLAFEGRVGLDGPAPRDVAGKARSCTRSELLPRLDQQQCHACKASGVGVLPVRPARPAARAAAKVFC